MSNTKYQSGVTDGATAVGHELDTTFPLAADGSKLLGIKNNGVEKFSIDKDGNISNGLFRVVQPGEGDAGIIAALVAVHLAGGGVVQLLAGTYVIDAGINTGHYLNNVALQGVGDATVLAVQSGAGFPNYYAINYDGSGMLNCEIYVPAAKGDTSVFLKPPYEPYAPTILAGDRVRVYGYLPGHNYETPFFDAEQHRVVGSIYTPAVAAAGDVTLAPDLTGADLADGETFTLGDGVNPATVFEFDSVGGVGGSNVAVPFTAGDDAAAVKASIISAVNGVLADLAVTASDGGTYVVSLLNDAVGSMGNVAITHTVSTPKFVATGMAGGVDASGEIQLDTPLQNAMDGHAYVLVARHGEGNSVRNLKVKYDSGTFLGGALNMAYNHRSVIENVTFEGFEGLACGPMCMLFDNTRLTLAGCKFLNLDARPVDISGQYNTVRNCLFDNACKVDNYYSAAIGLAGSWDTVFEGNVFRNLNTAAVSGNFGSGTFGLRRRFLGNQFFDVKYNCIATNSSYGCEVVGNYFDGITGGAFVNIDGSYDCLVSGNKFRNGVQGVMCATPYDSGHVITDNLFEDMTTYDCVSIQGGLNMVVSNNVFKNVVDAINLYASGSVITGNVIDGCNYGIVPYVFPDRLVVSNNVVRNASADGIYGTLTNSIVMGNNCDGEGINLTGTGNDLIGNKA